MQDSIHCIAESTNPSASPFSLRTCNFVGAPPSLDLILYFQSMIRRLSRGVKKFWAGLALLSVEMTIVLSLFVVALAAFVYITRRIFVLNKTKLDDRVFAWLKEHVNERNND